jgi:hypothetical protein
MFRLSGRITRVQGVHRGLEQVLVRVLAVPHHRLRRRREQHEAHVHAQEAVDVDEVRVQVGQQRRAGPLRSRNATT